MCACVVTTAEVLHRVYLHVESRIRSWSRVTADSDKSPVIRRGRWAARRRSSRDPGAGILFLFSQEVDGNDDPQRSLLRNRIFGRRDVNCAIARRGNDRHQPVIYAVMIPLPRQEETRTNTLRCANEVFCGRRGNRYAISSRHRDTRHLCVYVYVRERSCFHCLRVHAARYTMM